MALLSNNIFAFNVRKFMALMLPTALRRGGVLSLLWSLLAPLQTVARTFYNRRRTNTLMARYDSGKYNIERVLNILYDNEERRIYIENGSDAVVYAATYLFDSTYYQRTDAAYVADTTDMPRSYIMAERPQEAFTIVIPQALSGSVGEIKETASLYVLPGMSFTTEIANE